MKKIFCLLVLCSAQLFSAGPMTHLYFAEKWTQVYPIATEDSLRDFILGNLFPDIRYIAHFPREWTHSSVYSIEEILACPTAFEGGMKLHAFVDIVREAYVEDSGIYAHVEPYAEGHPATLLKFIEEEILAEFFDGRRYNYCLDWILEEELVFELTENVVDAWHNTLRYSMSAKPSWLLWLASGRGMFGISGGTLYNWSYLLPKLAKETIFREYVDGMLRHVEKAINQGDGITIY